MSRVCCVGGLCINIILGYLETLPRWGTCASASDMIMRVAGQSINVAFPLAKLGVSCSVIANVGDDIFGKAILDECRRFGVDVSGVKVLKGAMTGLTACVLNKDGGDRLLIDHIGSKSEWTADDEIEQYHLVKEAEYLFHTGWFYTPRVGYAGTLNLLKKARSDGKTILMDTGWDPANWQGETVANMLSVLRYVDIFLPNFEEAKALTRSASPEEMAKELLGHGPKQVIIKLGPQGSVAATSEGIFYHKAFRTHAVDTTCGGDAFDAGIIFGLVQQWSTEQTLGFANAIASIVISKATDRYCPSPESSDRCDPCLLLSTFPTLLRDTPLWSSLMSCWAQKSQSG